MSKPVLIQTQPVLTLGVLAVRIFYNGCLVTQGQVKSILLWTSNKLEKCNVTNPKRAENSDLYQALVATLVINSLNVVSIQC